MRTNDNKLIAGFIGIEKFKDLLATIHNGKISIDSDIYEQSKFHSDWNWLMEVVEKIENYNEFTNVLFTPNGCAIDCYVENGFAFSNDCDTKIEAVYNACVEFIKWYNHEN